MTRPTTELLEKITRATGNLRSGSMPLVSSADVRSHLRQAIEAKVSQSLQTLFSDWSLEELGAVHAEYVANLFQGEAEQPAKASSVSSTAEVASNPLPVAPAVIPHAKKRATTKKPSRS